MHGWWWTWGSGWRQKQPRTQRIGKPHNPRQFTKSIWKRFGRQSFLFVHNHDPQHREDIFLECEKALSHPCNEVSKLKVCRGQAPEVTRGPRGDQRSQHTSVRLRMTIAEFESNPNNLTFQQLKTVWCIDAHVDEQWCQRRCFLFFVILLQCNRCPFNATRSHGETIVFFAQLVSARTVEAVLSSF